MESNGQGGAAAAAKRAGVHPPRFTSYWLALDARAHQDEIGKAHKQLTEPYWTCKFPARVCGNHRKGNIMLYHKRISQLYYIGT